MKDELNVLRGFYEELDACCKAGEFEGLDANGRARLILEKLDKRWQKQGTWSQAAYQRSSSLQMTI